MPPKFFGLCWSCQCQVDDTDCIRINAEVLLPCCTECWGTMTAAERLQTALKFQESGGTQKAFQSVRDVVDWLLTEAEKRGLGGEDFEWMRRN